MSAKTQHQIYRLHSQLNNSVIRNYAKMCAREPMLINVNEGIATGDMVRMFSDMGEILVGTLATHHPKARHRYLRGCVVRS